MKWYNLIALLDAEKILHLLPFHSNIRPSTTSHNSNESLPGFKQSKLPPLRNQFSIMPELKPYRGDFYLWKYVPSPIAAGIVAGCFAVLTLWIVWRIIRTRTRYAIPFAIGGICESNIFRIVKFRWRAMLTSYKVEVVGYLARVWAAYNTDKLVPYAIQAVLILIAPALLAASVYMVLSRVIRSVNAEHHSIIRVTWLTRIFVLTDVLSFLIQSAGASLQTNQDVNPDLGKAVVLVGLSIQVIAFGMFILAAIVFHVRLRHQPTVASGQHHKAPWKRTMVMLYLVNGLIMCRSIFRIIEYSMGPDSYLFSHEWPLYTFDGEFMMLSMFCFAMWYPGSFASVSDHYDTAFSFVPLQPKPNGLS